MNLQLERIGTIGIFITALASPCCFPLFGFALTALGLGSFELFGGWTMWVFQILVLISLLGTILSYRRHKNILPVAIGFISTIIIFYAYHLDNSEHWQTGLYAGMFGLLIGSGIDYTISRREKKVRPTSLIIDGKTVKLESIITCPNCGHEKKEIMPTNSCQFFYECEKCNTVLKPKQGDCCVYCSYATIKCPSMQAGQDCC